MIKIVWKFSGDAFWVPKHFCSSKTDWVTNFWLSSLENLFFGNMIFLYNWFWPTDLFANSFIWTIDFWQLTFLPDSFFCLRPSGSETYKSECDWLPDWLTDSLTDWLTPSGRFVETQTVTPVSCMLGLWNFNKTSLTTRQLMSNDLTNLFQLLTAVISC